MDLALFIASWLRSPRHVGAIAPSSPALARALATQVGVPVTARVVELGAGTGTTTKALLDHGVQPENLIVVERDRRFCRQLGRKFPKTLVVEGDARHLRKLLPTAARPVDAVVSSLPLLSLGPIVQFAILREVFALLPPGGLMVQFTYGRTSPVHPQIQSRLALTTERVTTIWRNLPPATVWRFCSRQDNSATDHRAAA